ncbi:hypothetical protein J6590_051530 [Homalodisca vitripennis]|nr:hypothetical protein J6590_051530 [Homalodisca vitripennis]
MMTNNIKFKHNIDNPHTSKKVSNGTITKQTFLELINTNYEQHLHFYTDGSKSTLGTGAAYYVPELDITVEAVHEDV